MDDGKNNLFVYGSLRDPKIFKSVCGFGFTLKPSRAKKELLFAELALLPNHRKVSPDNVYYYAVEDASSRIEGYLVYGVPGTAMAEIDRYEGNRYKRETVFVTTAHGEVQANAYLVSAKSMKKHFGDRFHVNLIHELWLRKRIDAFINKRTRPGERTIDAKLERIADRELLATTERDLVISHYGSDAFSDFYLEHELDKPRPSIKGLYDDSEAKPFISSYLTMVVRQVIFNQLEERIQDRYRFNLEHMRSSERYFKRSISILVALQMINSSKKAVNLIVEECLKTMPYEKNDLIDYVKYAVRAAKSLFVPKVVESHLNRISSNFKPGLMPLGIEIELSNIGFAAVEPQRSIRKISDPIYDSFRYFHDFYLDILSWKLGGYIDDHSGATDTERRLGFLELAPGRLNITGHLSRPATADPWLLNQLIHAIANFYDVRPHSLHLSFQLRKNQIRKQKILPLGFVKCLLVLGGGLEQKNTGRFWVSRMGHDEITQRSYGEELVFTRTSKRDWYMGEDEIADRPPFRSSTYIQQYKFIRLDKRVNYETLILCLKGLQLGYNPADYLSAEQLKGNKKLQRDYDELKRWSADPTEINPRTIRQFLNTVQEGLMDEGHHRPSHELHYINWALTALDAQLRMFNKQLRELGKTS
jgi:gamma-glutamylcyclotransferase (GGCT)/AIG2-like uncharacterized protein YtfP